MNTILLAAGLSKRMGRQKLLLPFGEGTVIERVIENLRGANLLPVCAVLSQEVCEALKYRPEWLRIAINPAPERGQSSSLSIGLEMLPDDEDFCIMLGDLPLAEPGSISKLAEEFKLLPADKTVMAPSANGIFGHPMFYRAVWKERFRAAQGDAGGRDILMKHDSEIVRLDAPRGHFHDIDTPDDYKRILSEN